MAQSGAAAVVEIWLGLIGFGWHGGAASSRLGIREHVENQGQRDRFTHNMA